MELVVGSGEFEAVDGVARGAEAVGVGEPDAEGVAVGRDGDGARARVFEMLAVDEVASAEGEAGSDGLLVRRMNVVAGADVEGDGHGGVGDGERTALRVADRSPVFMR